MNEQVQVLTYPVCGIPIAALTPQDAASTIVAAAVARQRLEVHLCNAFTLSLVEQDHRLRAALTQGDLNLPDGTPVALLGKRQGTRGPVRGPGLVGDVAALGQAATLRHFLYGGKEGIAEKMAEGLRKHAPRTEVVATETPPFSQLKESDLDELAARVRESGANVFWIGLGTPKQDYLVRLMAQRLEMPIVPVGAAFDFWSGAMPEAPKWVHGSGLEWLYRLLSEPRRLWRRYLIGNPRFIILALKHWSWRR